MQYDLVFEGGGAKGFVFVGAMREFEARGHTHGRLLGTSAGAITATLLAAGYTSAEMDAALDEKVDGQSVFESFLGEPAAFDEESIQNSITRNFLRNLNIPMLPDFVENKLDDQVTHFLAKQASLRHIFSFVERGGWFSADSFISWMRERLDHAMPDGTPRAFGNLTLEQFHAATGADLSLVATDTTASRILVLNHRTAPQCPVVWAVRMSMNIPFLWQEVIWQADWGTYRDKSLEKHVIVDGGVLSNFPIELFISDMENVIAVMGPRSGERVLGFLIDDDMPVSGAQSQAEEQTPPSGLLELHTTQRILHLLNTMMQAHDKMVIDAFSSLVVHLPAKGYGTTEFNMTGERKTALVDAGCEAMQGYLDQAEVADVSYGLEGRKFDPQALEKAHRVALNLLSE